MLSLPRLPFLKRNAKPSIFYGPDDPVPIAVAFLMGIQRKYLTFALAVDLLTK